MEAKSVSVVLLLLLLDRAFGYDYGSKILNQRVTHYDNPYVEFNVRYYGDEGYPYLILKQPVTIYDDLHLMLYAKIYDGPPHLLANAPLSVCQLLHDENTMKNLTISQYNIPQIYGFQGRNCPIEKGKIRMSPYMFPGNFTTEVNIGCGYMNLESRLMKCNDGIEGNSRNCETLLKTVTLAFIFSDDCEIDINDEPIPTHGWVVQKFLY